MGKLTDIFIKNVKPTEKDQKFFDGEGLFLFVSKSGGKSWRIKFRFEGKEKLFTLGQYPIVTLAQARKGLAELKLKLNQNIDPTAEKKATAKAEKELIENTFDKIALDWLEKKQGDKTPKHRRDIISRLERFVFPTLQGININSITAKEMLELIRKIEAKGIYEVTRKVLGICNQVFSYAIGEGKTHSNPCAGLSSQLKTVKTEHFAFISDKKEFGQLLKDIDNYPHGLLIKIALQIAPLVFVRPSELVNATWQEIDFENSLWTIPEGRMKLRKKHLVPLSSQVLTLLEELHTITGDTPYLFANWNRKDRPITIDGLRQGLRRLGYSKEDLTTHGFRHTASTMLNELQYNRDHIEKQLAHATGNTVRGTYNHAEYLPERRELMQGWADYCDKLKGGHNGK